MIHAIGEQLATALAAASIPIPVVDGPERRKTTTFARERVVLEHFGEDRIQPKHKATVNPQARMSRVVSYKATIYAQHPAKGAAEFEHRRRCEQILDQVLVGLDVIVKARANILSWSSGKFVIPEDMKDAETLGGAVYELTFTIDRVVTTATFTGAKAPEATVGPTTITNQTQVTVNGQGTPEPACG